MRVVVRQVGTSTPRGWGERRIEDLDFIFGMKSWKKVVAIVVSARSWFAMELPSTFVLSSVSVWRDSVCSLSVRSGRVSAIVGMSGRERQFCGE